MHLKVKIATDGVSEYFNIELHKQASSSPDKIVEVWAFQSAGEKDLHK